MQYIACLRKSRKISYLRFNFGVQLDNFKEIKKFIKLAKKYNADAVWFQRIANWGTITPYEFSKIDVFDKKNLYYNEAKALLEELKNETEINIAENCL